MLIYNKYIISVSNDICCLGYIKSISYKENNFTLTLDADKAKKFSNISNANKEIEKMSRFPISINNDYSFDLK